jgi:hypothetical protein
MFVINRGGINVEQAIAKLKAEMEVEKKNPYVKTIGEFLLQHIQANPKDAEKFLAKDKTIAKSLDAMRKAAEKVKVGNMAMLSDAEGFALVLKYFGVKEAPAEPKTTASPSASFNVSLDDLLGGA